jgi:hypothetical protein
MNWEDKRQAKTMRFSELNVGDVFLCSENIIHIKMSSEDAFDVCNSEVVFFHQEDRVEKRNATLVLD